GSTQIESRSPNETRIRLADVSTSSVPPASVCPLMRRRSAAGHPLFEDYARGVMASPYAPPIMKQNAQLTERYPPLPLHGLGYGLIWREAVENGNFPG